MNPARILLVTCGSAWLAAMASASGAADAAALDEARKVQQELERARQLELAILGQKIEEQARARKVAQELRKLEAAAAREAERQKQTRAEAQRRAALDQEKARRREQQERAAQCRIKPVMTDDEIARCRQVRGSPAAALDGG